MTDGHDTPPNNNIIENASFRLICDGTENDSGRALFLISALHLCAPSLQDAEIHVVAPSQPDVLVAAEALAWDTAMPVRFWESADMGLAMRQGRIAVTVGLREPNAGFVTAASQAGIPCLIALQFPPYGQPALLRHVRMAHDTRALADLLQQECRKAGLREPRRAAS